MTDLTIGDDTFKVEVVGDAALPALVLSNSLGADLAMWDGQMAALSRRFRVIRYDARGHGGSAVGAAPVSIARLGRDVLAILDALEIETAHFIGLSMGGAVGLWLLVHAPERIERAVLANTAPRLGSPDGWNARISTVLADGMDENAAATIERWFSPAFAAAEKDRVAAVHAMLRKTSPQGYAACCAALRDLDLREALRGIRNDVLVVTGRDDPVVPQADADAFIAGIPGARHVALDARHLSNIEAEAAFNTAVVEFLTAKVRPRATARKPAKAKAPAAAAARRTAKRGGAGRRSNAARRPLKKAAAKRAPVKARAARPKTAATTSRGRPAAKAVVAARRNAAVKAATAKKAPSKQTPRTPVAAKVATKAAAKKTPAKKAQAKTAVTTRRAPPVAAARGTIKKAKPGKAVTKKPTKKRAAGASAPKKMPTPRRTSTTKPRRPTGRRKP